MHIFATNICVWIRTLVLESLKEITIYHQNKSPSPEDGAILDTIRQHSLRHAGTVLGTHLGPDADWEPINLNVRENLQTEQAQQQQPGNLLQRIFDSTANIPRAAGDAVNSLSGAVDSILPTVRSTAKPTTTLETTTMIRKLKVSSNCLPTNSRFLKKENVYFLITEIYFEYHINNHYNHHH